MMSDTKEALRLLLKAMQTSKDIAQKHQDVIKILAEKMVKQDKQIKAIANLLGVDLDGKV